MSEATYFPPRDEPSFALSFVLALAVHVLLIGLLLFGVRWQSHPVESVTVELWDPPPPPPPVQVAEAPKPPPPPPPPAPVEPPKPEPVPVKPEIVEPEPPKPKPKPEPKPKPKPEPKPKPKPEPKPEPKPKPKPEPKPEAKPAPPKEDEFQRQLALEQLALEQRRLDDERRRQEDERRRLEDERRRAAEERQRVDEARRKADAERLARDLAATARNRALADYIGRIQARVRQNWILPPHLEGNPEAIFIVAQLPTGDVVNVKMKKSSGNAAYDTAVERAIWRASPLPLPTVKELFSRELELTFRPRD